MENSSKKDIVKSALKKVKLVDAGVKNKYGMSSAKCEPCAPEDKVYYPSLYLDTKEAPMLSGCEVGEEVCLLVKAKVTSHSLNENPDNKKESFNLEIKKIGVVYTHGEGEDY